MRIRVELARSHDFPEGSTRHGYEFILPLGADGRLDRESYSRTRQVCTVHRFWEGSDDETGQIVHSSRGTWLFSFRGDVEDDEPIPHLAEHVFKEGEYLSVREPDGRICTFRIVLIRPAPGLVTPGA